MSTSGNEDNLMFILLWVARCLAVFCTVTLLHFIFSLRLDLLYIPWEAMAVILLFLLGFLSGLILAWHDEAIGGALAVLSVAAFCLVYGHALEGSIRQVAWIRIFAAPGLLFLLHSAAYSLGESRCPPSLPVTRSADELSLRLL